MYKCNSVVVLNRQNYITDINKYLTQVNLRILIYVLTG